EQPDDVRAAAVQISRGQVRHIAQLLRSRQDFFARRFAGGEFLLAVEDPTDRGRRHPAETRHVRDRGSAQHELHYREILASIMHAVCRHSRMKLACLLSRASWTLFSLLFSPAVTVRW